MAITDTLEKRFESDIEASFLANGYLKGSDVFQPADGLFSETLIDFVKRTQEKEWQRFVNANSINPERKFIIAFNNATDEFGLLEVLRKGFKHRGITFRVCYFKPESSLNEPA